MSLKIWKKIRSWILGSYLLCFPTETSYFFQNGISLALFIRFFRIDESKGIFWPFIINFSTFEELGFLFNLQSSKLSLTTKPFSNFYQKMKAGGRKETSNYYILNKYVSYDICTEMRGFHTFILFRCFSRFKTAFVQRAVEIFLSVVFDFTDDFLRTMISRDFFIKLFDCCYEFLTQDLAQLTQLSGLLRAWTRFSVVQHLS